MSHKERFNVTAAHTTISIGIKGITDAFYASASDPSLMAAPSHESQTPSFGFSLK